MGDSRVIVATYVLRADSTIEERSKVCFEKFCPFKKVLPTVGTFTLHATDSKCMYKDMINRVRRKHDFEAYHKRKLIRVKPMSERVRRRVKRKNRKMRLHMKDAEKKIKRKPKYIMAKKSKCLRKSSFCVQKRSQGNGGLQKERRKF